MKRIKGAYEAIKLRYLLFIFAAATLVALPLRVYQLLALIDNKTGFYIEDNGIIYSPRWIDSELLKYEV